MMERAIHLACLIFLIFGLVECAPTKKEDETSHEYKTLSLMAETARVDPRKCLAHSAYGTGFIWQGHYFVTAAHTIPEGVETLKVYVDQFDAKPHNARFENKRGDMALFRITGGVILPSLEIVEQSAQYNQRVYIVAWRKVIPCRVFLPGLMNVFGKKEIEDGDSGAPILTAQGKVVGIVQGKVIVSGDSKYVMYEFFFNGSPYSGPSRLVPVKDE